MKLFSSSKEQITPGQEEQSSAEVRLPPEGFHTRAAVGLGVFTLLAAEKGLISPEIPQEVSIPVVASGVLFTLIEGARAAYEHRKARTQ